MLSLFLKILLESNYFQLYCLLFSSYHLLLFPYSLLGQRHKQGCLLSFVYLSYLLGDAQMTLRVHSAVFPIQNNRSFHFPSHACRSAMQRQWQEPRCLRKYYFQKYFCYEMLITDHNLAGAILRTGSGQYGYQFQ